MRRREFVTLLGGAAAAWPLAARAQQPDRMYRIGVMIVNGENDPEGQSRIAVFRRGLQQLGWMEGRNLLIDYRWGVSEPARARAFARELVSFAPDVIVVNGTPGLAALRDATSSIPVVFVMVVDPVGAGYVQSLARPGGNITGFLSFEPEMGGKWLELLKEIAPGLSRVAGILDPAFRGFAAVWRAIETLGPRVGLEVTRLAFRNPADDIESAVGAFAQLTGGGLIVLPTAVNNLHRERIISLAASHRLPAVYPFPPYTTSGGLMSYGIDTLDVFRRSASYVDRILRSEKPADLPVQAPTKFDLVINLKTAKALGLTVPPTLLARADEVIE
jgi:putative tryptophan/tyrosine transport system substrate-binding protein